MMKNLYLFRKRIGQYIHHNTTLFVFFVIMGIINTLIFIYAYGNFLPIVANRNSEENVYRKYRVHLQVGDSSVVSYENYDKIRDRVESLSENSLVKEVEIETQTDDGADVSIFVNDTENLVALRGSAEITSPYEIVAAMGSGAEIGSKVLIGGTAFTVIGESSYSSWCISYDAVDDLKFDVGTIYVISKKRYDAQDYTIQNLISESFPEASVRGPDGYARNESRMSGMYIALMCIGYFIETISFTSLLYYIMSNGAKENVATAIVGATPVRITWMIYREGFALSIAPILLAMVIHCSLYKSVLSKFNFAENISYIAQDYLWIFLAMSVLIGVVLGGYSLKYHKKSVIALKTENAVKG